MCILMFMREEIIRHLSQDYTVPVRDPLWKHIYLSPGLRKIMYNKEFQKLGRIRQLGPASLVYPGASHTRLNHSLGVFYLARRILKTILFSEHCPDHLTLVGVKSFLCASFLHDIGHFPHAHSFMELPLADHEFLSGKIIRESEIASIIKDDIGGDPVLTAAIIDSAIPDKGNKELIFFRNILSGVLDPDKLDYLNRDAYFCGVPYGMQDIDFVISQIRPTESGICLTTKGVTAVENILFSKYLMYKTVYWHSDVRISTALVKKAVYLGLSQGYFKAEELYGMDDDEFFRRMTETPEELASLVRESETPRKYKIISQQPFDEGNKLHRELMDLDFRNEYEMKLAEIIESRFPGLLPENHLVIDIPSKISFEVDVPILDKKGNKPFIGSPTVFSGPVVQGFTETLRHIKVIVPSFVAEKVPELELDPFV
ncbi:HD domain-containing protein [Oceanispirochaeta sp. M1]|uniref:HD domain-containing protein n=2 Tax=Oceanispirochaeta TaxID=2035349 RepID=UPI0014952678|nr:HD domain-containing protein [Oceanispirochaeta sp. M1]